MSSSLEQQLQRIAELAQLELAEQELAPLAADAQRLLAFFDQLQGVDTSGVEPTAHALSATAPMRADEPQPSLDREQVLAQAPRSDRGHFVVPPVID